MHIACLGVFFVPFKWSYVALCLGFYFLRMFAITAGYHRYFSHRTFKTSRVFQFILAAFGSLSWQSGVLWWASLHRHHHSFSDKPQDVHSPVQRGFWYSHMGWIFDEKNQPTKWNLIQDFAKFPELRFLDRYDGWFGFFVLVGLYYFGGVGAALWGWVVSTVLLWNGTFFINSLAHVWGNRRYKTTDDSRNNWFLALITLGEGWHNNHHHFMNSTRQGFFWWEIDISYYILRLFALFGIVWDLKEVPPHVQSDYAPLVESSAMLTSPPIESTNL